jgi:hypothetical protein
MEENRIGGRIKDFFKSVNLRKGTEVAMKVAKGDLFGALDSLLKDPNELTPEQREYAIKLIELDIEDMKGVSERWKSDMSSDSWLSKNIRPITLAFLTTSTVLLIVGDASGNSFNVGTEWIDLLKSLLITVFVAYFGGRSFEKTKRL